MIFSAKPSVVASMMLYAIFNTAAVTVQQGIVAQLVSSHVGVAWLGSNVRSVIARTTPDVIHLQENVFAALVGQVKFLFLKYGGGPPHRGLLSLPPMIAILHKNRS